MPHTVEEATINECFAALRIIFSDFQYFDSLVADNLKQLLFVDSNKIDINIVSCRTIVARYYNKKSYKSAEQKAIFTQILLIFKTAMVMLLSLQDEPRQSAFQNTEQLVAAYPEFAGLDDPVELNYLLKFRNYMKVALMIMQGNMNKALLLSIAARLEGSQLSCVTGSGQKPRVSRRVLIFERESGVVPKRKTKDGEETSNDGTSHLKKKKKETEYDEDYKKMKKKQEKAAMAQREKVAARMARMEKKRRKKEAAEASFATKQNVSGFANLNEAPTTGSAAISFIPQCAMRATAEAAKPALPLSSFSDSFPFQLGASDHSQCFFQPIPIPDGRKSSSSVVRLNDTADRSSYDTLTTAAAEALAGMAYSSTNRTGQSKRAVAAVLPVASDITVSSRRSTSEDQSNTIISTAVAPSEAQIASAPSVLQTAPSIPDNLLANQRTFPPPLLGRLFSSQSDSWSDMWGLLRQQSGQPPTRTTETVLTATDTTTAPSSLPPPPPAVVRRTSNRAKVAAPPLSSAASNMPPPPPGAMTRRQSSRGSTVGARRQTSDLYDGDFGEDLL